MGFIGEKEEEAQAKPSELLRLMDATEFRKTQRGALMNANVLPDHNLTRTEAIGLAPASPFGEYGPLAPTTGGRLGDKLGSTHSVLNVRNAAKNLEECQKYIDLGCDVNAAFTSSRNGDTMGWAPIHFAAKWDRLDVLECLLMNGADPLLRTWDGENALVIARKRGNWAAFRILESFVKTGSISQHGIVSPYKAPNRAYEEEQEAVHHYQPEYYSPNKSRRPAHETLADIDDDEDEIFAKPAPSPKAWEIQDDSDEFD